MPEEIKTLLRKEGGNMAGGTGSTYEEGETNDAETKDHDRTGFAQNTQYSKKGDEEILDESFLKKDDPNREHYLRRRREKIEQETGEMSAGNPDYYTVKNPKWKGNKSKIPRPYVTTDFKTGKETLNPGMDKGYWHTEERKHRHARRQFHKDDPVKAAEWEEQHQAYDKTESLADAARAIDARSGKPNVGQRDTPTPKKDPSTHSTSSDSCPTCGNKHPGLVHEKPDDDDWENPMASHNKSLYKQWLEKKVKRPSPRTRHGFGTTQSAAGQEAQSSFSDATASAAGALGADFGTATKAKKHIPQPKATKFPDVKDRKSPVFEMSEEQRKEQKEYEIKQTKRKPGEPKKHLTYDEVKESTKSEAFRKLKPVYEGDTKEAKDTKKAYEVWLERQKDSVDGRQSKNRKPSGDRSACHICGKEGGHGDEDFKHIELTGGGKKTGRTGYSFDGGQFTPKEDLEKSDVEHGRYGSVGGAPDVAVSTDTKVDVTAGTGYEERPHISVEEAGKLPRSTFNESGSELTVSGSQDSKDEPKFSQPHSQEHPVRKAGLPQQHPNTYGVRYGMKGGVKKVWCPEHQMWEETRKDWHEDK